MSSSRLLKMGGGILLLFSLSIVLTVIYHPIIAKWIVGTARYIGEPIQATVFTDGKMDERIKVYHIEKYWGNNQKANNYLLYISEIKAPVQLKFISIFLIENWMGTPVGSSKDDYDFILGHLFQSETGGHFAPFQDGMKGFGFDPDLTFSPKEIEFKLPPNNLKIENVRIQLP